jgi:hypothetical protein
MNEQHHQHLKQVITQLESTQLESTQLESTQLESTQLVQQLPTQSQQPTQIDTPQMNPVQPTPQDTQASTQLTPQPLPQADTPQTNTPQPVAPQLDTPQTNPQPTNDQLNQTTPTTATKQLETYPYTCPLCLDEFQTRRELYRIVGCRHLYCQQCVVAYYTQSIKDRKPNVMCPTPTCETQILFCNVKNLLPHDVLLTYQRIALKAPQNQNKGSIWCPGKDCANKIMKHSQKKKEEDVVLCTKCKLRVCFKCGEWEHIGVVCDEAEQLTDKKIESENAQREAFEKWKTESGTILKSCPKCGAVIERNGGCSHMTCKACQHQFCYVCLVHTKATHCRS